MKDHPGLLSGMLPILVCIAVLSYTAVAAPQALAEEPLPRVLVTQDGERIELQGEFEERGSRVIFKDKRGRLRSLPKSAVDYEATRSAREAKPVETTATEKVTPPPQPVLVLNQSNTQAFEKPAPPVAKTSEPVRKTTSSSSSGGGKASGDPERSPDSEEPASGDSSSLEVLSWDDQGSEDEGELGTDIWGAIKNNSGVAVTEIKVDVRLISGQGTLLANEIIDTFEANLKPGETTNFNASWDDRVFYDEVEFEVSYLELDR